MFNKYEPYTFSNPHKGNIDFEFDEPLANPALSRESSQEKQFSEKNHDIHHRLISAPLHFFFLWSWKLKVCLTYMLQLLSTLSV